LRNAGRAGEDVQMSTPTLEAAAPAPAGLRRRGPIQLARFGAGPLAYIDSLRDIDGEIVSTRLGNQVCHLLRAPELIRAALVNEDWPPISRGRMMGIDRWYSGGLILTGGEEHHRQRDELWKPLLADTAATLAIAAERTEQWAAGWDGAPVELFGGFRDLCWTIDWQALTGEDMSPELLQAQAAGVEAMRWLLGPMGPRRWDAPTPGSARTRAARRRLDAAIGALIAARRAQPQEDLLSRLVALEPDDALVCATLKQWLGADQVHGMLTWTLQLLATNPDVEARWHEELDATGANDASALPLTVRILKEGLRLYPPVWVFFRGLEADYRLGAYVIPKGDLVVLSPYFTQRDPTVWPDPLRFDPDRWAEGAERPPEISYFPFSAGPYGCPAPHLAMQEAVLILATLGRRFSFRPVSDKPPQAIGTGAIVPKGGLHMRPSPR
jgi:cytochrome P450